MEHDPRLIGHCKWCDRQVTAKALADAVIRPAEILSRANSGLTDQSL